MYAEQRLSIKEWAEDVSRQPSAPLGLTRRFQWKIYLMTNTYLYVRRTTIIYQGMGRR